MCVNYDTHVELTEYLDKAHLPLYHVGPEDGNKVVRLGDKSATLPFIDGIISVDLISEALNKSITMTTYQSSLFCS